MNRALISVISLLLLLPIWLGCADKDMGEDPDSKLAAIATLGDLQALLDYMPVMQETPGLSEISATDFYIPADTVGLSLDPNEANAYTWDIDIFEGRGNIGDWNILYKQVQQANIVLDKLPKIDAADASAERNYIKGRAFFYRAHALYNVVLQFASLYDSSSKADGVPIRLTPDPETKSTRPPVTAVYQQIIDDLVKARYLVPGKLDLARKNRPTLPAVYALLARIYLSMRLYEKAGLYADSALQLYPNLIDYNGIYKSTSNPFSGNNEEIIYKTNFVSTTSMLSNKKCFVDSNLYRSYENNDLRKPVFFTGNAAGIPVAKYNYNGDLLLFSGLATDELYLVRAEATAWAGNTSQAMADLNTLRGHRYASPYTPLVAAGAKDALDLVRTERRKELIFRGVRWADIRRYNKEGARISLTRILNGKRATLQDSDDPRYILPIPPDIIQLTGMAQNPRN